MEEKRQSTASKKIQEKKSFGLWNINAKLINKQQEIYVLEKQYKKFIP